MTDEVPNCQRRMLQICLGCHRDEANYQCKDFKPAMTYQVLPDEVHVPWDTDWDKLCDYMNLLLAKKMGLIE